MRMRVIYGIDFFYMGKHLVKVYNPNTRTPVKMAVNMNLPIGFSVPGNIYNAFTHLNQFGKAHTVTLGAKVI